jgi:hypothetical protein
MYHYVFLAQLLLIRKINNCFCEQEQKSDGKRFLPFDKSPAPKTMRNQSQPTNGTEKKFKTKTPIHNQHSHTSNAHHHAESSL